MNVVDSSGWLEYFTRGENASFFIPPLYDIEHLLVPSICMYEVFKRLLAERDEDAALLAVGIMAQGKEIPLDRRIALEAAHISLDLKLAMADSIILATARVHDAVLWTQDSHFVGLEAVHYIAKKKNSPN